MDLEIFEESARQSIVAQMLLWSEAMRRDDEMIRKLMLKIEEDPQPLYLHILTMNCSSQHRLEYYHLRLLTDEGFLEETGKHGGTFRMTMKGHDFVAMVRSDTIWVKTKEAAGQLSGFSVSFLKDIAAGYIRQEILKLGIPLG